MSDSVFVCSFESCAKFFKKKSRLEAHIRSHTGERPYVCVYDDCNKKYARAAHLKRHEESVHQGGAARKDRRSNSVSGDEDGSHPKQYKCEHEGCGKVFKKHKLLKSHISCVHSEVKQYKCPHDGCNKSFWCASKLKCHTKVHKGYRCDVEGCDAVLPKWTLLRKHKMLEHASGECQCTVCGKTFRNRTWLKQHMLVHGEGRALYECPREHCDRSYLDLRNLNAHIRSYHDGKRFPCSHPGCDRTFTTKQKQLQHLGLHDPNRPPPKKRVNKGGRKRNMAATLSGFNPRTMEVDSPLPAYDEDDVISMESLEEAAPQLTDETRGTGLFSGHFMSGVKEQENQAKVVSSTMIDSGDHQLHPKDSSKPCFTQSTLPAQAVFSCGESCESASILHLSVDTCPSSSVQEISTVSHGLEDLSTTTFNHVAFSTGTPCDLDELAFVSSTSVGDLAIPMLFGDASLSVQSPHTPVTESPAENLLELDNFEVLTEQHLPICALCGELEGMCSESCANSATRVPHLDRGTEVQSMTVQASEEVSQETSVSFALIGGVGESQMEAWQSASMDGIEEHSECGKNCRRISEQLQFTTDLITDAIIHLADQH